MYIDKQLVHAMKNGDMEGPYYWRFASGFHLQKTNTVESILCHYTIMAVFYSN